MELTIQKADPEQWVKGLEMLRTASSNLAKKQIDQWQYWQNPPDDKIEWVKSGFENGEFYFISIANVLGGMVRLSYSDELYWGIKNDTSIYLHSLVILPEFSGKGIGNKVVNRIEQSLLDQKIKFFRLDCKKDNLSLCKYYEQMGFIKVGEVVMPHSTNNLYEKKIDQKWHQ